MPFALTSLVRHPGLQRERAGRPQTSRRRTAAWWSNASWQAAIRRVRPMTAKIASGDKTRAKSSLPGFTRSSAARTIAPCGRHRLRKPQALVQSGAARGCDRLIHSGYRQRSLPRACDRLGRLCLRLRSSNCGGRVVACSWCCNHTHGPHPEEPRSGVSKDEWRQPGHMVRDGAEPVIGRAFARPGGASSP